MPLTGLCRTPGCRLNGSVINAHASGTPLNDQTEKEGLRRIFGSRPPTAEGGAVVFGTKGNFGHSLGATGAIEAIALILALQSGIVPPVYGLEQPETDFPLRLVVQEPLAHDSRVGCSVTLGFGGFDTCLVFERGT